MTEITKSHLEKDMESQGWKRLGNVFPFDYASLRGGKPTNRNREIPISDQEIKDEFLKRGFKQVMVTDAYDSHAVYLPTHRAVYVQQGEKPKVV